MLSEAINQSLKWAESGWNITFGPREVKVPSLKEALELPDTFSFKLEAVSYWKRVEEAGQEAAQSGEKAQTALSQGDQKKALDAIYLATFIESPYNKYIETWSNLYRSMNQN